MHITLHITTGCNMRCDYCYSPPLKRLDMTEEVVHKAIDFASELSPENTGIIFFGGEPLLKKDFIESTINFCKEREAKYGNHYHYKVTTNGLLLDEEFLKYGKSVGLIIGLSIDGIKKAHDTHRKDTVGNGTFDRLEHKIDSLLKYHPYSMAMMTVSPENIKYYTDSVKYLFDKGFKYLVVSLNYAGEWMDSDIKELNKQYKALAKLYKKMILEQKKFYFSPFETKFASHIKGQEAKCYRCALAQRQVSISSDGLIYPCVQFVQDGISNKEYSIGNVWEGFDEKKRAKLYELSQKSREFCEDCALQTRCNNDCSCLNWQTTKKIYTVAPVLCETERILIPIVDKLGDKLYKQHAPMFIQKHYNAVYPIISLLEDIEAGQILY